MDVPALRRTLLDLIGTARLPDLARLDDRQWDELDRIAAMHRLQPLLHARHADHPALPQAIAARWRAARRQAAMVAMAQQAELKRTFDLLEGSGFEPVALKGAWLACHAYPDPAQRPMRDIDLLVSPQRVLGAFELLVGAGYVQLEPAEMALADIVRLGKHMPPLGSPGGIVIELHHRLWEPDGSLDFASPRSDETELMSRSRLASDGIRYLEPSDLLAHLIVHAVYSHRLDCGPLLLPDIAHLLEVAVIDWPAFWAEAAANGWRDGARLVLELVADAFPQAAIDFAPDRGEPTPGVLLGAAPDLLLQELATRASAGLAAATLKGGVGTLLARLAGRRGAPGEAAVTRTMDHEGGRIGWTVSRTWRTLCDLAHGDARRQSRQLAALAAWLDRR